MAIDPIHAADSADSKDRRRMREHREEADRLESLIDRDIEREGPDHFRSILVDTTITLVVEQILRERYIAAGWREVRFAECIATDPHPLTRSWRKQNDGGERFDTHVNLWK